MADFEIYHGDARDVAELGHCNIRACTFLYESMPLMSIWAMLMPS